MYFLKPGIKEDAVKRWSLPDRIFFGHGACHVLAGVYLREFAGRGFRAEWIRPLDGHTGNHIFVTNGKLAFDFHGYSCREALLAHHEKGWSARFPGWTADLAQVDFDLLDTADLNERKMRGADQFLHDPIPRAARFIEARVLDERYRDFL